jgi:hypothetical protein
MVAPSSPGKQAGLFSRFGKPGRRGPQKWMLPLGILLLIVGFVKFWAGLEYYDETSSLALELVLKSLRNAAATPLPPIFDEPPNLDCVNYLDAVRQNTSTMVIDSNDQKVFTKYMTNYQPHFWISVPIDNEHLTVTDGDKELFQGGFYAHDDHWQDVQRFETILKEEVDLLSAPLVFWNLQDWGWYPLLGASKGRHQRQVYVIDPSSLVQTIRLCESARMNRWTKRDGQDRFSIYLSGEKLASTISNEWKESKQKVGIFQVEGSDLSTSIAKARVLLEELDIGYLWLKWNVDDKHNNPIELFDQISKLKKFEPFWPPSQQYESFIKTKCKSGCSLWWKGL